MVTGKIITCMGKGYTSGRTGDRMMGNIRWIRSMGLGYIHGRMVEDMKDNG